MDNQMKPIWLEILTSNTAAALVTVLIGGIVGQLLLARYQNKIKQREQSVIDYQRKVERQQDTMQHAFELVAKSIISSDNLMQLTQPRFDVNSKVKEDQESMRKQKWEIVNTYNATEMEWAIEQEKTRLLLRYYYGQEALPAWQETKGSVERLRNCAFKLYDDFNNNPDKVPAEDALCPVELKDVALQLDSLSKAIEELKAKPQ